jgi:purine-binding chemotaxis protein CheW
MRKLCTFTIDNILFGVDVQKVIGVVQNPQIIRVPLANRVIKGLFQNKGRIMSVIDLRKRLELPEKVGEVIKHLALVKTRDQAASFIIEEAKEIVEIGSNVKVESSKSIREIDSFFISQTYSWNEGILVALDLEKLIDIRSEFGK